MQKLHKRLLKGLGANAFGQLATIVIQLVSVPIFLQAWGVELYGEWLILSTVPAYFAMSNVGFANVAANEMTMEVTKGSRENALEVFQSTWALISITCFLLFLVLGSTAWFMPIERWLNLKQQSHSETVLIVLMLVLHVMVKLQGGMQGAGFRCEGNYALGVVLGNLVRLIENIVIPIVALLNGSLIYTAAAYLLCRIAGFFYLKYRLYKLSPWIKYGFQQIKLSTIRQLAGPAVAFMGFPMGQALNNQGIITVIAISLGPSDVVTFSTLRTISRFAFQFMNMINNTVWPEISSAYASGNLQLTRKLHHHSCQVSIWMSSLIVVCLLISGDTILKVWTSGKVNMDLSVFYIFLSIIVANSLWLTSSVVPSAINQHQKIALCFLLGTIVSILMALILTPRFGLPGTAVSALSTDLIMSFFVIRTSLRLLKDDLYSFLSVVFSLPNLRGMLKI